MRTAGGVAPVLTPAQALRHPDAAGTVRGAGDGPGGGTGGPALVPPLPVEPPDPRVPAVGEHDHLLERP